MDKKLKILLDKVKESDPNLNTMDRNTRIRAGNYQFPFSGQQMDYLLLNLAKKLFGDDILIFSDPSNPQTVLTEITKYQLDDPYKIHTSYEVVFGTYLGTLRIDSQDTANSLYQYLGFTEEELTTEQFKNGLKNAILAYKDGPIA